MNDAFFMNFYEFFDGFIKNERSIILWKFMISQRGGLFVFVDGSSVIIFGIIGALVFSTVFDPLYFFAQLLKDIVLSHKFELLLMEKSF